MRTSVKGPAAASHACGPPSAGQAAVCPSVICSSCQGFFCFLFPRARNQYFGSKGGGGGGRKSPGDCSLPPPTAALCSRRNLPDSFSTECCRGNPAGPTMRREVESLPHQLPRSGRQSPGFLACAARPTAPSGPAAAPPLISAPVGDWASLPPGFRQSPALCRAGVSLPAWLPLLFPTIPARLGLGCQLPLGTGETVGPVYWEQGSYPLLPRWC